MICSSELIWVLVDPYCCITCYVIEKKKLRIYAFDILV